MYYSANPDKHGLLKKLIDSIDNQYDYHYLKSFNTVLLDFYQKNSDLIYKHTKELFSPNNPDNLFDKKDSTKFTVSFRFAIVLYIKPILEKFIYFLPKDVSIVLSELVWEQSLPVSEIDKMIDSDVIKKMSSYYFKPVNHFCFCIAFDASNREDVTLYLPTDVAKYFQHIFPFPESKRLKPVNNLPETEFTFEYGDKILSDISLIANWYKLEAAPSIVHGYAIKASTANKLLKKLQLKEFFNYNDKTLKNLRSYLTLAMLSAVNVKELSAEPLKLLEIIIKSYTTNFESFKYLLPDLKGPSRVYSYKRTEQEILKLIKNLETGKWYNYNDIMRFAKYSNFPFDVVSVNISSRFIYYINAEDEYYKYKEYIHHKDYDLHIRQSIAKHTFALFASFGILDLAYDDTIPEIYGHTFTSRIEELEYIRLTELGAYLIGNSKNYTPPKQKSAEFVLSENRLIIYIKGNVDKGETIIKDIARKIGADRWLVDSSTFLKNCNSLNDVHDIIEYFYSTVDENPPGNWEEFFKNLIFNSTPFTEINDVIVYRLPENDKLLQLFSSDDRIKNMVKKAENHQIIIEKKKLSRLKKYLKEFGYLID